MLNETTEGQHMELSWVHENQWNIKQDDYFTMCKKKTSWYTCITPCRLGNLIATNTNLKQNDFVNFGEDLGIAFQIRDDILNLVAGNKYGKESAGDLIEGKRTLILIHLLELASTKDRETVEYILSGDRKIREQNYKTILELIHKYDSLKFATDMADKFSLSALTEFDNIFDQLPENRAKLLLRNITEYIVSRDW
jgi:geranylgeranyl diphosphate synthase type II